MKLLNRLVQKKKLLNRDKDGDWEHRNFSRKILIKRGLPELSYLSRIMLRSRVCLGFLFK